MFHRPRFLKGVWRYLDNNGHEHISLMPFLFAACWGLGAGTNNHALPMDKKFKLSYDPPRVTAVAFRVENGMQGSPTIPLSGALLDAFGNDTWDGSHTSSSTSQFDNGAWTGGSSFSSNSSFGNDTWNN